MEDRFRFRLRKSRHIRRLLHRPQLFVADQRRVSPAMRDINAGEILPPGVSRRDRIQHAEAVITKAEKNTLSRTPARITASVQSPNLGKPVRLIF